MAEALNYYSVESFGSAPTGYGLGRGENPYGSWDPQSAEYGHVTQAQYSELKPKKSTTAESKPQPVTALSGNTQSASGSFVLPQYGEGSGHNPAKVIVPKTATLIPTAGSNLDFNKDPPSSGTLLLVVLVGIVVLAGLSYKRLES